MLNLLLRTSGVIMPAYTDIYTTIAGDMWDAISYKIFGSEVYMAELMAANPAHASVVQFGGGVELVVPDISIAVASSLPPWKR